MADLARMESALRNAHNAGDAAAAKAIANALKAARSQPAQQGSSMNELSQMSQGMGAPKKGVDRLVRANMEARQIGTPSKMDMIGAGLANVLSIGTSDEIAAGIGALPRMIRDKVGPSEAYGREKALINRQFEMGAEAHPKTYLASQLAGAVAGGAGLAKQGLSLSARAAGKGLGTRAAAGAAEGGILGAAYGAGNAAEGQRLEGAQSGGMMGAAFGGAVPVVGAGLRSMGSKIASGIRGAANPTAEAQARIQQAMARDSAQIGLQQGDEALAAMNNQQLLNVDRGGETTRALARAASNVAPEARSTIEKTASDRFATQGPRAVNMIKRVAGEVDDIALQSSIRNQARASNSANYKKAYDFNFGANQPVQLDAIQQRIPASAMREALAIAKAEGKPFGGQLVASIDDAADNVTFKRTPSMREWDYIQRGLRGVTDKAYRSGSGGVGTAYKDLRSELLGVLDDVNPYFKQARVGASAAFGADDAVDAGRNFARASRNTPEMMAALKKMTEPEKKAFKTGFASELIDKIKSTNDRSDVIRSTFQTAESREKIVAAFGDVKARELEAFVRIEGVMDALRGAMGNSTTARQLMELGLVGGSNAAAGTYGLATGDWRAAALTGAATGVRYGRTKVDEKVMKEIARILVSQDPALINRVAANASMSKSYLETVRRVTNNLLKYQATGAGLSAGALAAQ